MSFLSDKKGSKELIAPWILKEASIGIWKLFAGGLWFNKNHLCHGYINHENHGISGCLGSICFFEFGFVCCRDLYF